ncbi:T9SS type A sorting domain-containing protein [bacterium]|nr:T9SS type A sorting domain-containing protein [bacterium]
MMQIKRLICCILAMLSFFSFAEAQTPVMEWFKGQGTSTEEHVHEGMQTSDGGYIAIGDGIEQYRADDMLIIKVNENGIYEWKWDFGTANKYGAGYCISEVADGYIAGGAIFDPDSQRTQRFLTKLDFTGDVVWKKFYGSSGVGGIRGIDITSDGSIVATGYINTPDISEFQGFVFIVDEGDGFIMKLDADGNVDWEQIIDAPQGTKVREISDGFAVCSCVWNWTQSAGDQQDFCLIKTDNKGNTVWRKTYGGDKSDHLYDFDLTDEGGYILAGHTLSYGVSNWDYLLMKIDSAGEEVWHKIFGQPRGYDARYIHDEAYGVRQTPDGGFIICGGSGDEYSYSASGHPAGPSDEWKVYLVKTDKRGEILWEGIYPPVSVGNNGGEYIGLTNDGGYIVFVDTDSQTPPAPNNFGFMKLASDSVNTLIYKGAAVIHDYQLFQNYPNPFNSCTVIHYSIEKASHVVVTVYNIKGQKVAALVNKSQAAGTYNVIWNAQDVPSGVYFYRLKTNQFEKTNKMLLLE